MPDTTKQTMAGLRKQIADKMKNENILTRKISKLEDKIVQLQSSSPLSVKKMMGGTMKKPVMAKKGKMNKLNPGLKAYLAKKKKTKKKK